MAGAPCAQPEYPAAPFAASHWSQLAGPSKAMLTRAAGRSWQGAVCNDGVRSRKPLRFRRVGQRARPLYRLRQGLQLGPMRLLPCHGYLHMPGLCKSAAPG